MLPSALKGRKANSLGALTKKIVQRFPKFPEENEIWEMSIEDLKKEFKGKVGTIYEILVILESVLLVTKVGRFTYRWNGYSHLRKTLAFFNVVARETNLQDNIRKQKEKMGKEILNEGKDRFAALLEQSPEMENPLGPTLLEFDHEEEIENLSYHIPNLERSFSETVLGESKSSPSLRPGKMHHLEVCQRILMVFLAARPPKTLTLQFCGNIIFENHSIGSEMRRLYDVANVFSSIPDPLFKLVAVNSPRGRVRAFQYCGPDVSTESLTEMDIYNLPEYREKNSVFTWGKEILNVRKQPDFLKGFQTVRILHCQEGASIFRQENLVLGQATVAGIKRALSADQILLLQSKQKQLKISSEGDFGDEVPRATN